MNAIAPVPPLILNVDDDAAARYVKNRSLRMGGLSVMDADTGQRALLLTEQHHPAVVLLDVKLPDLDGWEVCRRIKQEWPDIIVVQVSATLISTADRVMGLDNGADCYLTAPIEASELIAVMRAMLRLRSAEIAAQEIGEQYRMIVESAVDYAIITCSLDGRVTSWNSGAEAILGYSPEEIIGHPCARIFTGEDLANDVPEQEMRAVRAGSSLRAERWHRRRDGTTFWSSGRMVPLRDGRGQSAGFLKILIDRTAEKMARDQLKELNEVLEQRVIERTRELEEANARLRSEMQERERTEEQMRQLQKLEALGQLTGGIAHDFNNLLTAIIGGLEVTKRRVSEERTIRLIDSSLAAAARGAKLVSQLLAFARRQTLQVEPVLLTELVLEMRDLLERSIGSSVSISYDLPDDIWPTMIDANQMQTALLNLAINARDAMPDGGGLRIMVRNVASDAEPGPASLPDDHVVISLADTGEGMTEEIRSRVFEPFFTTKEVGKGTGLGLAQVYGFVCQSGGTVEIESTPGQGTTVFIALPRVATH
ncbi:MAG: ATP-binding protein [Acetobacteraceae bacterium]